ncbi:Cyclin-T1-3 [Nymphaea thermarum]|nr:Cyclin-T1-3 [Nymphaea thermarum]
MAGMLPGDPSHHGMVDSSCSLSHDKLEEADHSSSSWYFSRKVIEENSPSRKDDIDVKKETYFRKSYCTLLQDLGMRLKVPQVTIATAIIFCHRFFLRQSHAKNDRKTIATVCMFLAGKVEETPRPLKDVILVSYEIIYKKDPAAVQRIKQKEVYEQQKEHILLGERVVLATLGFDLNVHHPYKPLVEAIKKFKVAQNALAQVAWNFVNDGLRTSLCLQFKPHHIAAGAIFLAAKFLKVKLPSDGEKFWWQEFDVTPRQLEEVSNQMLELYEQNRAVPPSHGSEVDGVSVSAANHRAPAKALGAVEDIHGHPQSTTTASTNQPDNTSHMVLREDVANKYGVQAKQGAQLSQLEPSYTDNQGGHQRGTHGPHTGHGSAGPRIGDLDNKFDDSKDRWCHDSEAKGGYSASEAVCKIDKDKVKAAIEKRRKSRIDVNDSRPAASKRVDVMDEDDLIEQELESGVELAAEAEKIKQERRQNWSKSINKTDQEARKDLEDSSSDETNRKSSVIGGQSQMRKKSRSSDSEHLDGNGRSLEPSVTEEGELSGIDVLDVHSPKAGCHMSPRSARGEKTRSPYGSWEQKGQSDAKNRTHYALNSLGYHHQDTRKETVGKVRHEYLDREHKRHKSENPHFSSMID